MTFRTTFVLRRKAKTDSKFILEDIYNTFYKDELEADEEAKLAKESEDVALSIMKGEWKIYDKGKGKIDDNGKGKSKLMVSEKGTKKENAKEEKEAELKVKKDLVLWNDVKYLLTDVEIRMFKEIPTTSTFTRSRALIASTSNAQAAAPRGDFVVWDGILNNGGCFGDFEFKGVEERTKGTKEETGDGLCMKGRSNHSSKAHLGESLRFQSRGRTGKLKCFICHSEGHLNRDCLMKKSSGFVKNGKRDQYSNSSDDDGNAYFGEALVVVRNDEMTELVSNDDVVVAQRRLEDKQLEEKTNTDYLVKEQEKEHLGIKVGAKSTVTIGPGQEGAEGNVAEKKKVEESMKSNLGKLLKYKTWLTRRSLVRGSSIG
nr:zinc finger, CCHC-type [Tanacetum cinerariifolium]